MVNTKDGVRSKDNRVLLSRMPRVCESCVHLLEMRIYYTTLRYYRPLRTSKILTDKSCSSARVIHCPFTLGQSSPKNTNTRYLRVISEGNSLNR